MPVFPSCIANFDWCGYKEPFKIHLRERLAEYIVFTKWLFYRNKLTCFYITYNKVSCFYKKPSFYKQILFAFLQKANCWSIPASLSVAFFLETNTLHKQNLTNLSDLWSGWVVCNPSTFYGRTQVVASS